MQTDIVINMDWIEALRTLPDCSVNCGVTSPPYYRLRDYGVIGQLGLEQTPEEYINKLVIGFREFKRVLRDDGILWINIADCYWGSGKGAWKNKNAQKEVYVPDPSSELTKRPKPYDNLKPKDLIGIPWMLAFALRADGWYLRSEIIWNKPNAMPESVKDRCTNSHETIFMLSKSQHYYFDNNAIKEPAINGDPNPPRGSYGTKKLNGGRRKQDELGLRQYKGFNQRYFNAEPKKYRNKRDVWTISTKPFKGAHFATFPPELIEPCILAGCPEGGTVCDMFFGSGTTGEVAKKLNCHFIGIELNPIYVQMSKERIFNATSQQRLF